MSPEIGLGLSHSTLILWLTHPNKTLCQPNSLLNLSLLGVDLLLLLFCDKLGWGSGGRLWVKRVVGFVGRMDMGWQQGQLRPYGIGWGC